MIGIRHLPSTRSSGQNRSNEKTSALIKMLDVGYLLSTDKNWKAAEDASVRRTDKKGNFRLKDTKHFSLGIVLCSDGRQILAPIMSVAQRTDLLGQDAPPRLILTELLGARVNLISLNFVFRMRNEELHFCAIRLIVVGGLP